MYIMLSNKLICVFQNAKNSVSKGAIYFVAAHARIDWLVAIFSALKQLHRPIDCHPGLDPGGSMLDDSLPLATCKVFARI